MPMPARLPHSADRLVTAPTRAFGVTSPMSEKRFTEKVWWAASVIPIRTAAMVALGALRAARMVMATTAAPLIR